MKVYVLVILCFCTLRAIVMFFKHANEDNGPGVLGAIVGFLTCVLAIIFQSINL